MDNNYSHVAYRPARKKVGFIDNRVRGLWSRHRITRQERETLSLGVFLFVFLSQQSSNEKFLGCSCAVNDR